MQFNTIPLISELTAQIRATIDRTQLLLHCDLWMLQFKPTEQSWNIVEVISHLNTYNHYYLPLINDAFEFGSVNQLSNETYKSGWLGDYFVKLMQPDSKGQVTKKMKAAAQHLPGGLLNPNLVISEFIGGQEQFLKLLEQAPYQPIQKIKIPVSIAKIVKLRAGDVMRFLVAHQQRHFIQIAKLERQATLLAERESNFD